MGLGPEAGGCVRKSRHSTIPSFVLELCQAAQSGSLQRCLGKLVCVCSVLATIKFWVCTKSWGEQ